MYTFKTNDNEKGDDISVGQNGQVWIVSQSAARKGGNLIKKLRGTNWRKARVPGGVKVAVMPDGKPFMIDVEGQVHRYTSRRRWSKEDQTGVDIAIGPEGSTYVLGQDTDNLGNMIYKRSGSETSGQWARFGGSNARGATSIAVDSQGNPWIADKNFDIWKWTINGWAKVEGRA